MTPEIVSLIKDIGLPVALVVVFIAFILRSVWPEMVNELKAARDNERRAIDAVAGLKETLVVHNELSRQMVEILKDLQRENKK